jgi:anti-anti-sigma factor
VTGQLATLAIDQRDGVAIARIGGEIDLTNVGELGERIARSVPNGALGLVIDLERTTFVDTAGLRLLFHLSRRLSRRGQQLRIALPEGAVIRRALTVAEVPRVAPLCPDLASALASVAAQGPSAPAA